MTEEPFKYRLLERIGRGSSGEVFLAEASSSQLQETWPVAIKVLSIPFQQEYLQHEAQRLRDLRYPQVLGPIDVITLDAFPGRKALVMDYVPGADLYQILRALLQRGEPVPLRTAVDIGCGLLEALVVAHEAPGFPLLHRSLSPADIRLSPRGEVNVVGFAVHRYATASTGPFCAPEQRHQAGRDPEPAVAAGDVFAAAAIVLWLVLAVSGDTRLLYAKDASSSVPALADHERWLEASLRRASTVLDSSVEAAKALELLRASLAKRPEHRPEVSVLYDALQELSRGVTGANLLAFAARTVPLAAQQGTDEGKPAAKVALSRRMLPQGVPELGFAISLVLFLVLLVLLAGVLAFTTLVLRESLAEPLVEPVPLEERDPEQGGGFREDPFLHEQGKDRAVPTPVPSKRP